MIDRSWGFNSLEQKPSLVFFSNSTYLLCLPQSKLKSSKTKPIFWSWIGKSPCSRFRPNFRQSNVWPWRSWIHGQQSSLGSTRCFDHVSCLTNDNKVTFLPKHFFIESVSWIWARQICLCWFSFRLEPIFNTAPAQSKWSEGSTVSTSENKNKNSKKESLLAVLAVKS